MKNSKRIISAVIAVLLAFAMAIPGFSEELNDMTTTGSVKITMSTTGSEDTYGKASDHQFYGYMLMSASVDADEGDKITRAAYKINPTYREVLRKTTVAVNEPGTYPSDQPTDDQIIEYLSGLDDNAAEIRRFADIVYFEILEAGIEADAKSADGVFDGVAEGYWLIVGREGADKDSDDNTLVMLDTTGKSSMTVNVKPIDEPEVEKEVLDEEDAEGGKWKSAADYQIGDLVPFKLTAHPKDPANLDKSYDDFEYYKLKFTDTLSEGLRYYGSDVGDTTSGNLIKVYAIDTEDISKTEHIIKDTTNEKSNKEQGYVVTYDSASRTLTVDFADLKSIVDTAGTPISITPKYEIIVEYYAELLPSAASTNHETNTVKIEYSNDPLHQEHTKESTEVTVDVYTYGLVIDKKGINESDIEAYLEGAEFELYKLNGKEKVLIQSPVILQYYALADGEVSGTPMPNGNEGPKAVRFTFEGLDEGTYVLTEKTVPAGYNGIPDITFTISPNRDAGSHTVVGVLGTVDKESEGKAEFTPGTGSDGSNEFFLYTTIVNKTGLELPSTGGTGRTVLVLFGCLCALIAGVILVTNKRMKSES